MLVQNSLDAIWIGCHNYNSRAGAHISNATLVNVFQAVFIEPAFNMRIGNCKQNVNRGLLLSKCFSLRIFFAEIFAAAFLVFQIKCYAPASNYFIQGCAQVIFSLIRHDSPHELHFLFHDQQIFSRICLSFLTFSIIRLCVPMLLYFCTFDIYLIYHFSWLLIVFYHANEQMLFQIQCSVSSNVLWVF